MCKWYIAEESYVTDALTMKKRSHARTLVCTGRASLLQESNDEHMKN